MQKDLRIANPTIGADIEVFIKNKETSQWVSAETFIKGTKTDPFLFINGNPYFATSLDNVMAEFCIPPVTSHQEFNFNIHTALSYIEEQLPEDYIIKAAPSAFFLQEQLKSEAAQTFGCDPDYNAWKMGEINPKPNPLLMPTLRTAGGHIHIGYDKSFALVNMELVRAMDIFIALPSVLQEPFSQRKLLYGKAGAFRHKPYGVEYRSISNYYLESDTLTKWVFDNTQEAIKFVNNNSPLTIEEGESVQRAINTNNKDLAKTMCNYFGVKLAA